MKENTKIEFKNGNLLKLVDSVQGATLSNVKLILHSKDGTEARTTWKGLEVLIIPIEGSEENELPFRDDISFISPTFQKPIRIVKNAVMFEDEDEEELY